MESLMAIFSFFFFFLNWQLDEVVGLSLGHML